MTLDELAIKYDTDKSSLCHNYAEKYDLFLQKYIDKKVNILEIGVYKGSSIKMWKEYFNNANIFAIDNNPACKFFEETGIEIFTGDQYDEKFLNLVCGKIADIDIIIDDGSHIAEHQIKSFEVLFPKLKPEGIYVIEDLHTTYMEGFRLKENSVSALDFLKQRIDDIQFSGKNVSNWLVGDKKNHYESFRHRFNLNYYEKYIKAIHFYKSICFIEKDSDWI